MTQLQVKRLLRQNKLKWSGFSKWMNGQTVKMKFGKIDYYSADVLRYIDMKIKKK